jgi:NAD(P)-dependent dehydrogenase (short-subunit alcohol dehydrogenase family)
MASPQHKIGSGFGAHTTAAEVLNGIDLSGRLALVTGGYSGLGLEATRALTGAGAHVIVPARRPDVAAGTLAGIEGTEVAALDLGDLESVRAFAERFLESGRELDIVIDNAGIMATPETRVGPGWEAQFATNHLGHFALTAGLHGALAAAGTARIVSVSSSGHLRSPVVFDDIDYAFREYDPFGAYGQSKTANVLFAVEATRRWARDGITANSLMPGGIVTELQRHVGGAAYIEQARERYRQAGSSLKTPEQGAATSVLLAAWPGLDGVGGRYFEDCNEAEVVERRGSGIGGVAPYALDPANAERLWELSLELMS